MKIEMIKCNKCGDSFNPLFLDMVIEHEHDIIFNKDWVIGDKFTTPETNSTIFTVSEVKNTFVIAKDKRSASGYGFFNKNYIKKI